MNFELADIYEAMRFLGCDYGQALAWLEAQELKWLEEMED